MCTASGVSSVSVVLQAALAPVVTRAASAGDAAARGIIDAAASGLVECALFKLSRLPC